MPDPHVLPAGLPGWLSYLEQLHPKSIALGLDRVGLIKERLGLHPPFPVITVAGTNGKGSTCAMLERIYLEAGYKVACYTSPHLLRYNERVRVNGAEVGDDDLCAAFSHIEPARQGTPLTYFEYGTLAAMWHFMRAGVDVAILEVGLGGRLDAVNIFEPACAILTSVDIDHTDYLGHTREGIGREKAGIFRTGIPAICGDADPPLSVQAHARDIGADLRQIGHEFDFHVQEQAWRFESADACFEGLSLPALNGAFQMFNAACVVEAIQCMQPVLPVSRDALCAGMQHVRLAGRFQQVTRYPQVILDVAHNPHAALGLAENLRHTPVSGKTIAVCAMLSDKDIGGVMRALVDAVDVWHLAGIQQARGAGAGVLVDALHAIEATAPVHTHDDCVSAFRQACLGAGENDRIVVFGSFYTVADVMRQLPETFGDAWQPVR